MQVKAEGIFPIHTAPDRISRLAVREPFHILHDDDQRQAPGGDFHGAALRGIEIRQELIVIERAELRAQVDIEVAFGKSGPHGSRGRIWNGGKGFRASAHGAPPSMTMSLGLAARTNRATTSL